MWSDLARYHAEFTSVTRHLGASMLVMGAYTHSRLREFFLGGVTQHMLDHAEIPVLMAH